jgi:phage-related protein
METFQAVFYRDLTGREPVRELVVSLDTEARSAIGRQIDRLNLLSDALPHLPFPHSSQVDGELRELRCHYGKDLYRVLYRRSGRLIVLLHIFAKRSAKIDRRDIQIAQDRWADFKARMDASPRVPPRAAGHDAP